MKNNFYCVIGDLLRNSQNALRFVTLTHKAKKFIMLIPFVLP
jgi:hypothetical protein